MTTPGKSAPKKTESEPGAPRLFRLKLVGVGGAGGNAVHEIGSVRASGRPVLTGVDLLAVNTDLQALDGIAGSDRLQIGAAITRGLAPVAIRKSARAPRNTMPSGSKPSCRTPMWYSSRPVWAAAPGPAPAR